MDLSSYSLPDLRRLQTKVESEIRRRSDTTRRALLKQVQKLVAEQGLTLDDLIDAPAAAAQPQAKATAAAKAKRGSAKKTKAPSVIKYRNPANPEQGWSGHGRRPQWVLDWLGQGKPLEELAA
ncbi:H-NS family nucleoid-associated regulatory protein [Thauera linaloolentis]|uniref:Putative trans-acting regulatory protein HvrA n=1 Tax=Thauera linaloolentis (strain DSM 12138 / JCM 21573 / CCUG 41526 / CIP 105981 / IAM 15112 / NBRC 102519 / 47Lol) TaxID=1123367 RepID=N6YDY2_THAL4|nr:H-NS histone family protein [Thauera linaloolentis]ENO89740.1 putative trans-acting regulatory protein HvrA [Thauera linaloolentis 47Lol = DSM 12138]MCM8566038.1 H-NS histone family protein [Thauera linaloolentis]